MLTKRTTGIVLAVGLAYVVARGMLNAPAPHTPAQSEYDKTYAAVQAGMQKRQDEENATEALKTKSARDFAGAGASTFTNADICKAAISVEMGRPTKTMKTQHAEANPEIYYRRADGDSFRYRCQVSEGRVIWSTFLADTNKWGRWRNRYSEGDASTTYSVSNGVLTISNDQSGDQTFKKKDF
ncbi:hypothetical protein [Pseudomonas frederiksbergensis]|uniref:hypothetical protein n=1 Tax=Pseudomonas frederiksbergensis TaxID=104087 RepID=UPI003D1AD861